MSKGIYFKRIVKKVLSTNSNRVRYFFRIINVLTEFKSPQHEEFK